MSPSKNPGFNFFRNFVVPSSNPEERYSANKSFATYGWLVLFYNVLVVAYGVFLRAAGLGDGCGENWPLCTGVKNPAKGDFATFVESSHRISTTLVGLLALVMVVWSIRVFAKGHAARKYAFSVLAFTIFEGLIGAVLVKFKLVTSNDAPLRAFVMGLHVLSTFALLGSIAAAALAASGARKVQLRNQGFAGYLLAAGCLGMLFLGVTGAISAFGHQVNPDVHGLAAMTDPKAFWASRLAVSHPYGSASVGLYLFLMCGMIRHLRPDPFVHKSALLVMGMLMVQMLVGVSNIWLKAPIPMQMIHLVIADLNWVSMVTLVIAACGVGIEHVEYRPAPEVIHPDQVLRGKALLKAYLGLTKPRIISLLLFTTLTAAIAAKGSWPGITLFSVIAVAGYMAAGAANAINMVIDRDIDVVMKRTASRPTVTQSIPSTNVLTFAFTLAALSFSLLWGFANLLSALMAMSGLVFYVVIYTMLLKRRTWQNIVIGGAAGAFPPLVGWAAITNDLPPLAIYLFAIVFVWTPVHFWALALLLKDEYEAAGVPMLPNVKGDSYTVKQIAFYTGITIVVTLAPMLLPQVGWIYGASAVALNAVLVWKLSKLMKVVDRPQASGLFHYSMIYLAILFFMLAVDRVVIL